MNKSLLSKHNTQVQDRLIFALDLPTFNEAKNLVLELGESINFYKIGLELFMSGEYFPFIDFLKEQKKKIFVDLKLFDIPETIKRAVSSLAKREVDFISVHGNDSILEAAAEVSTPKTKILAVTVLTSLDNSDIKALGFINTSTTELVLSRAKKAYSLGCDGIISSGLEVKKLKSLGHLNKLIFVCPGIRPVYNTEIDMDDQKRTTTAEDAFLNGADYIVIGRPIRNANNPKAKAEEIQSIIKNIFS